MNDLRPGNCRAGCGGCRGAHLADGIILREAGPVKGTTVIAFVQDPDGYKIELIERADGAGGLTLTFG